jgi:hypothetical protein
MNRSLVAHLRAVLDEQEKTLALVEAGKLSLVRNGKDLAPDWIAEQKRWITKLQQAID